jgi:hypothetical protein
MKKMMTISTLVPVFRLIIPQAFADPQHCNRPGWPSCWPIGNQDGLRDALSGAGYAGCSGHSSEWCSGYNSGYFGPQDNGIQQSESSEVTIHGNHDDLNIEQAQNAQSGSSENRGDSYHGANPKCLLICATVSH